MEDKEIYEEFAKDYGIDYDEICTFGEMLKAYPVVLDGEKEDYITCLEIVLQSVCTKRFKDAQMGFELPNAFESLTYIVNNAIYRTYGDIALRDLDQSYLDTMGYHF